MRALTLLLLIIILTLCVTVVVGFLEGGFVPVDVSDEEIESVSQVTGPVSRTSSEQRNLKKVT